MNSNTNTNTKLRCSKSKRTKGPDPLPSRDKKSGLNPNLPFAEPAKDPNSGK